MTPEQEALLREADELLADKLVQEMWHEKAQEMVEFLARELRAALAELETCRRCVDDLSAMYNNEREQAIAAQADAERMDWLESTTKLETAILPPGEHGGLSINWLVAVVRKQDKYGSVSDEGEGANLRAAIDAARAESKPE